MRAWIEAIFQSSENRAVIEWIAGVVLVLIGGLWVTIKFFFSKRDRKSQSHPTMREEAQAQATDFFVYISQSKLDMLVQQIPAENKSKSARKASLELGPLTTEFSAESSSDTRHNVVTISNSIELSCKLRTLERPEGWLKDRLSVKHVLLNANPHLYLLVGKKYNMYHLLGGSSYHVIGNRRPQSVDIGYSYLPFLAEALTEVFAPDFVEKKHLLDRLHGRDTELIPSIREHEWADWIYRLYEDSHCDEFNVKFLARFLARGRSLYGWQCTISSPLYVALE